MSVGFQKKILRRVRRRLNFAIRRQYCGLDPVFIQIRKRVAYFRCRKPDGRETCVMLGRARDLYFADEKTLLKAWHESDRQHKAYRIICKGVLAGRLRLTALPIVN